MSAAVQGFRSTDAGAPTLSGTASALINVLNACLVTGYGSKTLTALTRAGDLATATVDAGHNLTMWGAVGPIIRIEGAAQAAYNGDHRITVLSATQFTFPVTGNPVSPATGTITAKRAPLGWEQTFSGPDKAAYRSLDPQATRCYLHVLDNGPHATASFREARWRGYETMTDIDTGDGPFPTATQSSFGCIVRKSSDLTTTARSWLLLGNGRIFYLYATSGDGNVGTVVNCFGDIVSTVAGGDAYGCFISARSVENNSNFNDPMSSVTTSLTTTYAHYMARHSNANPGAIAVGKHTDLSLGTSLGIGRGSLAYPHPLDNALYYDRLYLHHNGLYRGYLPGIWNPLHNQPFTDRQLVTVYEPVTRHFLAISLPNACQCLAELSDTWYA